MRNDSKQCDQIIYFIMRKQFTEKHVDCCLCKNFSQRNTFEKSLGYSVDSEDLRLVVRVHGLHITDSCSLMVEIREWFWDEVGVGVGLGVGVRVRVVSGMGTESRKSN